MATALVVILGRYSKQPNYTFLQDPGWTLVGPEYSDGLLTGATVVITGKDEAHYTVLQTEVLR